MTLPHAIGDLSVGSDLGQQRAKSPVVFYQPQVQLVHLVLRLRFRQLHAHSLQSNARHTTRGAKMPRGCATRQRDKRARACSSRC
jgi:hypothetical protein